MIPLLLPATKSSKRASDDWTHAGFRQGLDNHPLSRNIQILEGARIRRHNCLNPVEGRIQLYNWSKDTRACNQGPYPHLCQRESVQVWWGLQRSRSSSHIPPGSNSFLQGIQILEKKQRLIQRRTGVKLYDGRQDRPFTELANYGL